MSIAHMRISTKLQLGFTSNRNLKMFLVVYFMKSLGLKDLSLHISSFSLLMSLPYPSHVPLFSLQSLLVGAVWKCHVYFTDQQLVVFTFKYSNLCMEIAGWTQEVKHFIFIGISPTTTAACVTNNQQVINRKPESHQMLTEEQTENTDENTSVADEEKILSTQCNIWILSSALGNNCCLFKARLSFLCAVLYLSPN